MMYKKFHSNSTRSFEYLGEVAIERSLDPSEVMSVYQTLNDSPDTEVPLRVSQCERHINSLRLVRRRIVPDFVDQVV